MNKNYFSALIMTYMSCDDFTFSVVRHTGDMGPASPLAPLSGLNWIVIGVHASRSHCMSLNQEQCH